MRYDKGLFTLKLLLSGQFSEDLGRFGALRLMNSIDFVRSSAVVKSVYGTF